MVEIYTHTLTGDSAEDILMLYGVKLKGGKRKRNEKLQQEMVGPHCPLCHTPNIPDTQFCASCGKPVALMSMNKIMEETKHSKQELQKIKEQRHKDAEVMNVVRREMVTMQSKMNVIDRIIHFMNNYEIVDERQARAIRRTHCKNDKMAINK
jgi:uncharacterized Zn finger protein (UPF0148 family)